MGEEKMAEKEIKSLVRLVNFGAKFNLKKKSIKRTQSQKLLLSKRVFQSV